MQYMDHECQQNTLTETDIASFHRLGITPSLLGTMRIQRLTDMEARAKLGRSRHEPGNFAGMGVSP
jgi:hypothetical protein